MIAIDAGNSRLKWAQFEQGELLSQGLLDYDAGMGLSQLQQNMPLSGQTVVLSCVMTGRNAEALVESLQQSDCEALYLASSFKRQNGVVNAYARPETLGVDRWLAIIAAHAHPGRENRGCCVIDLGTAATLDFVDGRGQHLGGYIMPGYRLMLDSLGANTGQLPELSSQEPGHELDVDAAPGTDTNRAILHGVFNLLCHGLYGQLMMYIEKQSEPPLVLLTGGDMDMIGPGLTSLLSGECQLEVLEEPGLVLKGLELVSQDAAELRRYKKLK